MIKRCLLILCCVATEVQYSSCQMQLSTTSNELNSSDTSNGTAAAFPDDAETTTVNGTVDYDLFDDAANATSNEVLLSCACAPYFQCEPSKIIVPELANEGTFPPIRIQMENCSSSQQRVSQVCCMQKDAGVSDKNVPEDPDRCGIQNSGGVATQKGGTYEADYGEFPWVVAILEKADGSFAYKCGGSIIDKRAILTTAHCVARKNASSLKIRAGEWDSRNNEEFFPHQERYVTKIVIHPDFNSRNLNNDIALLILDEPLVEHIHVGKICLPPAGYRIPETNISCFSTGWGKGSIDRESLYKLIPKKIALTPLSWKHCQQELRNTRLGSRFRLHQSFTCAWDRDTLQDTCTGDGGSPLMCTTTEEPDKYQLIGMVAWGIGCSRFVPGVYVNIPFFTLWIEKEMKNLSAL